MKKLIIILSLGFVFILLLFVFLYQTAMSPLKSQIQKAETTVVDDGYIKTIDSSDYYFGKEHAIVIQGENKDHKKIIAWVQNKKVTTHNASEGLTKKQIMNQVQKERNPKEIVKVKLGIENNIPLWEVEYIDHAGHYNYYYASFKNGQLLKRYSI